MTPKQMALSRLARLALNAASESPPHVRADVCRTVHTALQSDCPDLAQLAVTTATYFDQATDAEADLLSKLQA
jgi:hypothetical protein